MRLVRDWSMGGPRGGVIRLGGPLAPEDTREEVVLKDRGRVVEFRPSGEARCREAPAAGWPE